MMAEQLKVKRTDSDNADKLRAKQTKAAAIKQPISGREARDTFFGEKAYTDCSKNAAAQVNRGRTTGSSTWIRSKNMTCEHDYDSGDGADQQRDPTVIRTASVMPTNPARHP